MLNHRHTHTHMWLFIIRYMHGTSFLIAIPPTQSKTAVVSIHHFLFLLLSSYVLSYACSIFCSDKPNSDTSTLCERPFPPPSYSPWTELSGGDMIQPQAYKLGEIRMQAAAKITFNLPRHNQGQHLNCFLLKRDKLRWFKLYGWYSVVFSTETTINHHQNSRIFPLAGA